MCASSAPEPMGCRWRRTRGPWGRWRSTWAAPLRCCSVSAVVGGMTTRSSPGSTTSTGRAPSRLRRRATSGRSRTAARTGEARRVSSPSLRPGVYPIRLQERQGSRRNHARSGILEDDRGMSVVADRQLRIGVVPFLDGSGGGISQYSATMLDGLLAIEPRPELVLFTDRRGASQAENWRSRGYRVVPLWPQTARWKLGRVVGRITGAFAKGRPGLNPRHRVRVNPALGEWIARSGVDVLIFSSPQTVAFASGLPYIMAVHDLQHRLHPEFPEVSAGG